MTDSKFKVGFVYLDSYEDKNLVLKKHDTYLSVYNLEEDELTTVFSLNGFPRNRHIENHLNFESGKKWEPEND